MRFDARSWFSEGASAKEHAHVLSLLFSIQISKSVAHEKIERVVKPSPWVRLCKQERGDTKRVRA